MSESWVCHGCHGDCPHDTLFFVRKSQEWPLSYFRNINIQDSLQQLKEAVEELEALRTVIAMAEDHPVYSCDRETLIVTRTALEPILKDLREVTEAIREELKIE